MGWPFKKQGEEMPEEKKSDMDALLEKFSAAMDEKLKPVIEKQAAFEPVLSNFKSIMEQAAAEEEENRRKAAAAASETLTDEEKRANREQALFNLAVEAKAMNIESQFIARLSATFPKLVPDLQSSFSQTDIRVKARPDYAKLIEEKMNALIGQAALKGGLSFSKNSDRFVLEDGAASGGAVDGSISSGDYDWQDPHSDRGLNGSQQLKKMGMTQKQFEEMQKNGFIQ